jgi:Mn-dependent DtxR family transcriptional regulator
MRECAWEGLDMVVASCWVNAGESKTAELNRDIPKPVGVHRRPLGAHPGMVDQKGYARVTDIAAALGLSRSTVSNMIRRLAKRGFVNYEKYRGLTLTTEGRAVADHIKVRHQTLTELLQLLGLSPATVEQEVEVIEHHLRPETLRVFSRLVRFWRDHPEQLQAFLRDGKSK